MGRRDRRERKKSVLISKMPQVEFDWEAIRENQEAQEKYAQKTKKTKGGDLNGSLQKRR